MASVSEVSGSGNREVGQGLDSGNACYITTSSLLYSTDGYIGMHFDVNYGCNYNSLHRFVNIKMNIIKEIL